MRPDRSLNSGGKNLIAGSLATIVLVASIVLGAAVISYYAQKTLSEIEEALPITLARQENEVTLLVAEMDDLVHAIYRSRLEQASGTHALLLESVRKVDLHLRRLRNSYSFNDLIGVSAIHAALSPAIFDIQIWLTEGVSVLGPDSPQTLKLVEQRAINAHSEGMQLLARAAGAELGILTQQSQRIGKFRDVVVAILGLLLLMSMALVFFVIRQQRTLLALKQSEEQNRVRANYDAVTGLPNRANFIEHLGEAVARGQRSRTLFALLYIDLDRFKTINDTLGHDIGDQLIKQVGVRIRESVRNTDLVARLGGDEFTVLLADMSDVMHASLIAKLIVDRLAVPFQLGGHEVYTSASIGITVYPTDSEDASTLLKNADMAMYQAKERGRNTFRFFTTVMTEQARQFLEIDNDLRRALEQSELYLEYQPIYDLEHNLVSGVEALMRWYHPEKGMITPDRFIPVAEETGLIVEMGRWALGQACRDAMRWLNLAPDAAPYLAVNVSMRQFKSGFGKEQVESVLQETGFPADRLVLEITESLLMEEDERVHEALEDFRNMGVELAVDDFGTGYSALNYLRQFPVSILKIDRSFIEDMVAVRSEARLVETIIAMAKGLNLRVVAEGVETVEQQDALRELHCGMAQGFLLGRPTDAASIFELLMAQLASRSSRSAS